MVTQHRRVIVFAVAGTVGGYLIFHPYAMMVYLVAQGHETGELRFHWSELASRALEAFGPMMFAMSIPFVVFGAVIGLLLGVVVERTRRLDAEKFDHEKRKVALETMKKLMVTLSHYLLNSNMIIGGKVRHCRKGTSDEDILSALAVIEEQGRKIDAVVRSLRESTEIRVADYTSDGKVQMIDIAEEIEDRLNPTKTSAPE